MSEKHLIKQLGMVLKKSRGEPSKFVELIVCIGELNREGKIASCSKIVRKLWPQEWQQAQDKINFEKTKWDLLCKRRRAINRRVLKSHLCFAFYIELTPDKQFVLIHDPEEIYNKRVDELERNLAKATSETLKEKIKTAINQLEYQYRNFKKGKTASRNAVWKWAAGAAIVVLFAAATIFFVKNPGFFPLLSRNNANPDPLPASRLPAGISIAVLPFDNMTGDPEQDHFSDGITEEVITALSKLPGMDVIDRNSTFVYRGKTADMQKIRHKLGAHYVLQGSIRKTADRVRITAQLSDASTGLHLWADRWERDLYDVFAVQDDITMQIVTELVVILKAGEHARLLAKSTRNLEAFINIIAAYHHFFEGSLDDTLRARQMCEGAIAIDPSYVAAYALLADTYLKEVEQSSDKTRAERINQAHTIIQTALAMDPSDALVHNILSRVYTFQDRLDMALSEAKKAVDIYPNSVECINWQGLVLMRLGRPGEAIRMFNRSLSLNPKDPSLSLIFLGLAYTEMKQYDEAISHFEQFLLLKPKAVMESLHLAALYASVGRNGEARAIVNQNLSKDPTLTVEKVLRRIGPNKQPSKSQQWLADHLYLAGLP